MLCEAIIRLGIALRGEAIEDEDAFLVIGHDELVVLVVHEHLDGHAEVRAIPLNGAFGGHIAIGEPVMNRDGWHLRRPLWKVAVVRDVDLVMASVDPHAVRIGEPGMGAADPALTRPGWEKSAPPRLTMTTEPRLAWPSVSTKSLFSNPNAISSFRSST